VFLLALVDPLGDSDRHQPEWVIGTSFNKNVVGDLSRETGCVRIRSLSA
jgi:hypothetical protein